MAAMPCSIHAEFFSSSASVAPWSRPSSPSSSPPLPELCSAGRPRSPFPGPFKTLAWNRSSAVMGTRLGMGGGGECTRCCSDLPQHSCIRSQTALQFTSTSSLRHQHFAKQAKFSGKNLDLIVSPLVLPSVTRERTSIGRVRPLSATESSRITSEDSPPSSTISEDVTLERTNMDSVDTDRAASGAQLSSTDAQPTMAKAETTAPAATQEGAAKRAPLTAREKLRAARVLSKYTDARPSRTKSEMGSRVLDAIRESDRGKKRSGLPEAPSNLFDDSKRGMPKQGLTFDFPGGNDMLLIAFSFVFISTVMFATTYVVWKVGAIHFNEY